MQKVPQNATCQNQRDKNLKVRGKTTAVAATGSVLLELSDSCTGITISTISRANGCAILSAIFPSDLVPYKELLHVNITTVNATFHFLR